MRYYKTAEQEQELKKMPLEEIFNCICARKMTGIYFHDGMYRVMTWLGLPIFARQQKGHYEEESKSLRNTEKFAIEHLGVIPKAFPEDIVSEVDPFKIFGKVQRTQPNKSDKEKVLSRTFERWLWWESETNDLLKDFYDEITDRKCITSMKFLEDLISDNDEEIRNLKQQVLELADVEFDLEYVHRLQHKLEN